MVYIFFINQETIVYFNLFLYLPIQKSLYTLRNSTPKGGIVGWLVTVRKIVRKVFKKASKDTVQQIPFDGLGPWLDLRFRDLMQETNLGEAVKTYRALLAEKRRQLEQCREQGVGVSTETAALLEVLVSLQSPDLSSLTQLNPRLREIAEQVLSVDDNFSSSLSKSPVRKLVSELDTAREYFNNAVTRSGYPRLAMLSQKLSQLQKQQVQLRLFQADLENKRRRFSAAEENKKEKGKQVQVLKTDPGYVISYDHYEKRAKLITQIEKDNDQIFQLFSSLKPLLEKYLRLETGNELVRSYLDNPTDTFLRDEGLSIKHVLQHLEAAMQSGKFPLSEKERGSFMETLHEIDERELEQLQVRHYRLSRELQALKVSSYDKDLVMEIDEAAYRLDHFTRQTETLHKEVAALQEKIGRCSDKLMKDLELFQHIASVGLGRNIVIKI